ncbi:PGAP1-like protein [Seminavis robusta]|uniref:GPI inositol-deacylase n=1 Tax=Seminavis robusta TaxID=568900 RepID=A0A9N8HAR3_9STRA|nr:PGAP1-like protein [Seminavis robusta]|eukprot:Sro251_g099140.1 PGAP1-like protein (350) ;mRNA; r:9167-10295
MRHFLVTLLALLASSVHVVSFHSASLPSKSVQGPLFSADTEQASTSDDTTTTTSSSNQKISVLLCPAQFCVPVDYEELFDNLQTTRRANIDKGLQLPEIGTCRVAPLPRTEWIKVARQLPTRNFLEATLSAKTTLGWYFDAIEQALSEIYAIEGADTKVCIIAHSIGGWVARGYLGGLAGSSTAVFQRTLEQCSSLITLGTPHSSPEEALVDQTRGLLREIENTPSCSPQALADLGIDVTCVGSAGVDGSFLSANPEELVAASSYLPLMGKLGVKGDGITPLDLAFLEEPARKVVVENCSLTGEPVRHAHVLPTPWNLWDGSAPSIKLPEGYVSYVSEGVLPQWSQYIR